MSKDQLVVPASVLAIVAAVVGIGCRGRPHVEGTVAVDTILRAWSGEGFVTSTVTNIDPTPWSAGVCSRGMVDGLDVLLCEYASEETLVAGEQRVTSEWRAESVATGATVRASRTMLAIADRTSVDASGQTIARLIKSFRDHH